VIEFEAVSKTFRDGTTAVSDLTFTVPSGKITVVVGPSGCGKTTTLRMVNRMLEPTAGRILWDGTPLRSKRKTTLRRQMGYVIQSGGLFPHRTVVENIGTVPGLLRWSKEKTHQRALELLGSVGLDRRLAERYPAQLSGGQQQRVGVARALAADPMVLLMDEPFSAVDPVVRSELHDFFLGLQQRISKTIILITHDIDEAIKLGDQVAILRVGGKLAQVGTPQHLLEEPADAFVEGFVGKDRGYRSLSFLAASALELERVKVVRSVEAASDSEPTLMVDADARPVGWADVERPGNVFPLGSTFIHEADTLRAALDSALTSPYSLAVAVAPDTGRFAGVVSARNILDQVKRIRADSTESISVAQAEAQLPEPVAVTESVDEEQVLEAPARRAVVAADSGDSENADRPEDRDTDAAPDEDADVTKDEAPTPLPRASEEDADDLAPAPAPDVDDGNETEPEREAPATAVVSGEPVDLTEAKTVAAEDRPEPIETGVASNHDDSADDAANVDDPDSDADRDELRRQSESDVVR
jgi:osmoprotectant transport system ATP-binding protein